MEKEEKIDVSIVIPAYNEERRLGPTLFAICDYFFSLQRKSEIIVVDDGSTDGTREVVSQTRKKLERYQSLCSIKLLVHNTNYGKGAAVKTGMLAARGSILLFTDADLSTPITEFHRLEKALQDGADVVIGSRALPDSRIIVPQPWLRRQIGRFFPFLVRKLVLPDFKDTQCGFKAFKKETGQKLFRALKTTGFAFDVEVLLLAKKYALRIQELPVTWYNKSESKVVLWKSPWLMLKEILSLRRQRS